jgi:hypothetical protein
LACCGAAAAAVACVHARGVRGVHGAQHASALPTHSPAPPPSALLRRLALCCNVLCGAVYVADCGVCAMGLCERRRDSFMSHRRQAAQLQTWRNARMPA